MCTCRDSRAAAQKSYSKAFGTSDMPAETWIDFEKDMLLLSQEFCRAGLTGWGFKFNHYGGYHEARCLRPSMSREGELYKFFLEDLSPDIQKVKDLAVNGISSHGTGMTIRIVQNIDIRILRDTANLFLNLERITCIGWRIHISVENRC